MLCSACFVGPALAQTYETDITADTTLTSPVVVPPGYTQVTYGIGNGATLTLAPGSDPTSTFYVKALTGGGQIVNNTAITTNGAAIANDGLSFTYSVSVTNNGTIQSAVGSGQYAIATGNYGLLGLVNTGSITATGAGGGVNAGANLTFSNSGSVTADGTAVNAFDNVVTNSGTITSNNGVGFYGLGNVGTPSSNSGSISGLTVGAELNGYYLTNTGTISSSGLAVSIDSTGKLINAATGRVIGDIGTLNGNGARLDNAGIINGNVNFGSSFASGNVVTLRPGSVITGNLVLGIGNDTLATSLVNTGSGQFAGVNGTVTGGGAGTDTLRYFVTADASITALGVPSLFGNVIYDLANNANLTLTPGDIPYSNLGLVGVGTVDLTANIVAAGGYSILDLTKTSVQGNGTVLTALDVTSRGTLTGVRNTTYSWQPLVQLSSPTKFTNAGTILAEDATPDPNIRLIAVQGSGTVVNSGTINLLNADGVDLATTGGSLSVTNSGTITGIAGDTSSRGIARATTLINTGVISTGQWTVLSSTGVTTLTNSGQLRSAYDTAVWLFGATIVTNQPGGIIGGATYGISVATGNPNIVNAGSITGGIYSIYAANGNAVTLTLQTGSSLGGDVLGGVGANNSLILQGGGTEDSNFLNFRSLNMQGPGNWTLSGMSSIGATTVSGGTLIVTGVLTSGFTINSGATLQIGNGGTSGSVIGNVTNNGFFAVNRSDIYSFAGVISGTGAFQQFGIGTTALTGATTYSGGTTIASGTLQIGAGGTTGSIAGNVADNGALVFNRSDAVTFSGVISGTGSVSQSGPGTLLLSGSNTYTGGTVVTSGTLQGIVPAGGALAINGGNYILGGFSYAIGPLSGTGGTITGNQGFLTTNSNINTTLAASIVGADQLTKTGNGTLTLTGGNNFFADPGIVISGGAVQIGNGGTSGSVGGNITANGSLIFNRSDTSTYAGRIYGSGTVQQAGSGTLILTGNSNQFAGTTIISAGTLQIGNGGAAAVLPGNIVDNSVLAFDVFGPFSAGPISGSGSVQQTGTSTTTTLLGANTYTGGTVVNGGTLQLGTGASLAPSGPLTVNSGTFDLNGQNQTVGIISGSGGFIALSNATLTTNTGANSTYAGQFTGIINTGGLIKTGTGTLTLTNSSIINSMTIAGGAIQLGNGGTNGLLINNITDNGMLIFNRSDAVQFNNLISGSGSVTKLGAGALSLSGSNLYTGVTTVNAGTLNVTGSIASSNVSVASGATLTGTGKVGATSVASGGTLTPGSGAAPGTLTIAGNLALAAGSNFVDAVTPSAAGLASVGGTASINGNALANFASGSYASGQQYTLITAAGGVSGTFASLATTGLPGNLRGSLSYDANDVYLNLKPDALAPSLASNTTTNQHNVVAAIDAAVMAGATPTGGFNTLYNLSGPALNSAIDQISGQIGPNVSNAVGQNFLSFLAMTADGGAGGHSYAPGSSYGAAAAPHRAQLDGGETRVWGAGFGGHVGLSADAATGAAALSASNAGLIGGADLQLADHLLAGVTLGWGREHFNSGNGSGTSTDYAVGLYGRADMDEAYVTAAFGYSWHQIETLRVITVSGTDALQGKQNADDYGGRIEAGWRVALDDAYAIAPYAAFAGESFASPAYAEIALSGSPSFALSYAAHTGTLGRSELGAHLDRSYALGNGGLTADIKAAWAHQLDDRPFTQASFESLPTAGFQVLGVRPTRDAALLGADLELQYASGLFLGLKGEGQFGAGTTIVEGLGSFGLRW
jgi:autotransporter-associated beta strand protein